MYLRHADWLLEFERSGLVVASWLTDASMMSTIYLLHRTPSLPKQPTFIDVDDVTDFSWIEPLKDTLDAHAGADTSKTIWLTNTKVMLMTLLCLRPYYPINV